MTNTLFSRWLLRGLGHDALEFGNVFVDCALHGHRCLLHEIRLEGSVRPNSCRNLLFPQGSLRLRNCFAKLCLGKLGNVVLLPHANCFLYSPAGIDLLVETIRRRLDSIPYRALRLGEYGFKLREGLINDAATLFARGTLGLLDHFIKTHQLGEFVNQGLARIGGRLAEGSNRENKGDEAKEFHGVDEGFPEDLPLASR